MDNQPLQPLSGFRDLVASAKPEIVSRLREIFESFGYINLETPALERQALLLNKFGDEAQKQLYLFEDNGQRPVGLRYDLTVPLARYVAANFQQLNLPFKRYEIGPVWRAEKAQKGRYRQFTQADVDIVGVETLGAEKELLEIMAAAEKLITELTVSVNDRRLVAAVLGELKVKAEKTRTVLQILDKKLKVDDAKLASELLRLGLTANQVKQLRQVFLAESPSLEDIEALVGQTLTGEIRELLAYGRSLGLEMVFEPSMVRGLDYYTGPIFEAVVRDGEANLGSVLAGGRYDDLVESLNGQKIPAVGISFGVDRLVDTTVEFIAEGELFIAALPETEPMVRQWATKLRQKGKVVEVYPDAATELGKQIKYADRKGYLTVYLPFADEWARDEIVAKDLGSGTQQTVKRQELETDEISG